MKVVSHLGTLFFHVLLAHFGLQLEDLLLRMAEVRVVSRWRSGDSITMYQEKIGLFFSSSIFLRAPFVVDCIFSPQVHDHLPEIKILWLRKLAAHHQRRETFAEAAQVHTRERAVNIR